MKNTNEKKSNKKAALALLLLLLFGLGGVKLQAGRHASPQQAAAAASQKPEPVIEPKVKDIPEAAVPLAGTFAAIEENNDESSAAATAARALTVTAAAPQIAPEAEGITEIAEAAAPLAGAPEIALDEDKDLAGASQDVQAEITNSSSSGSGSSSSSDRDDNPDNNGGSEAGDNENSQDNNGGNGAGDNENGQDNNGGNEAGDNENNQDNNGGSEATKLSGLDWLKQQLDLTSSKVYSYFASGKDRLDSRGHNFGAYIVEDMTASEDLALPETFDWSIIRHGDDHIIIWCEEDITGRENTLVSASVYNSATGEISAADAVVISRAIEGRTFNALNTAFPDGVSWLADSVKTGKVAEYFNGRTAPLNSNGTNWGKPISQQMRPVVPNLAEDFTWRVEKQAGGFIIYWVDLDASTLSAGDLIEGVAKYDTSSGVTSSVTMEVQSDKTMKEYAEPAPMLTALLSMASAEETPAEEAPAEEAPAEETPAEEAPAEEAPAAE